MPTWLIYALATAAAVVAQAAIRELGEKKKRS